MNTVVTHSARKLLLRQRALCGSVLTLSLLLNAVSPLGLAQQGDAAAQAIVERARAALKAGSNGAREAERLYLEALQVPAQSPAQLSDRLLELSLYLTGTGAPGGTVRPLIEQATALQRSLDSPPEPAKQALPLEILSMLSLPEVPAEQFQEWRARAQALRVLSIDHLRKAEDTTSIPSVPVRQIGAGVSAPVPIHKPEPGYTEEARLAKKQGSVLISVVLDSEGVPRDIRLLRSLGFGLDEQAYRTVSGWRFKPATTAGEPVPVKANIEINFRLL